MSTTLAVRPSHSALSITLSILLATSAAVFCGYQLYSALDADDLGRYETTMALSVASQLQRGPGSLYGPYSAANPLVLIHAPLYYRLTALLARPLVKLGAGTIGASLAAGRFISLCASVAFMALAYRLSILDGESPRAGVWSALLIASSPIPGILLVMVRPDALAVALQTLGIFLTLRHLHGERARPADILFAYIAFALAFCTKQHSIAAPLVSTALLATDCIRGRTPWSLLIGAHLLALGMVVCYLGGEDLVTAGMMSRSVFVLPSRLAGDAAWWRVGEVALNVLRKTIGLAALALAGAAGIRRNLSRGSVDVSLGLYLAAEILLLVPLCLYNEGAAGNYALQAVVLACVLIARGLSRACERNAGLRSVPAALVLSASCLLLGRDVQLIELSMRLRREDRTTLRAMLRAEGLERSLSAETYFVDLPQYNRLYGQVHLVHDEWLYGAFERLGEAAPRSNWLRSALTEGPIRRVIVPSANPRIPGLAETLPELGYKKMHQYGRYRVWVRNG